MSVLSTKGIVKDYPGTRALDDVTVSFESGKVHAFIGKNGSGKSTLVKVFAGAIQPTEGQFFLDNEELHFENPMDAMNKGSVCSRKHFPWPPSEKRTCGGLEGNRAESKGTAGSDGTGY